jgi:iron complex outermembrane receptor protein
MLPSLRTKRIAAAVALAFIATPFDVAWAQQVEEQKAEDAKAGDSKAGPHLETITVSGERVTGFKARTTQIGAFRDAEILDVPMTINVVPRTVMDVQEAQGLFDALKNTAGVARAQVNGTAADNLSIRGVQTENRTSFRLNGGLPVNNLVEMPMEDKERVEALKGSSALYYGFTSPAGVVNMVTKRARSEPVTSFTLSGNEFGQYIGHVDLGRQWGDNKEFGLRVNAAGGEVRNAIDDYKGRRQLFAAAFDWRATDKLSFKLDAEDIRRDAVEQASVSVLAPNAQGVILIPNLPDPTKLLSGTWALTSGDIVNFQGRGDYFFNPDWALMAEIGRAETNRNRRAFGQMQNYNVVTGQGTLRVGLTRGQGYINENGRTELAGRFLTWGLDHEIMLGFMRNKRYQNGPSQQVVNLPQNLYNPVVLNEPLLTATLTLSPQNIQDDGFYVFDRIRIGERWQVQLGARRTDYENKSITGTYAVKDTTPAFGLIFKPRPDTSLYYSYIEGLEEGGTAPLTTNNPGQVLQPGVSKQHELGVRSEAVSGLLLSAAYFTIERATAYTNAANFFVLDGRTEYKGFEYSATGEIGRNLSVYLSGMFLDAEQTNAQNALILGKMPDNTPKQTHSLFVDYRPEFLPGAGVNFGVYYYDKRFVNNAEQGSIPAYTLFTVGARYATKSLGAKLTTFQVYVENLADKNYWAGAGGGILAQGLPRTIKMSMKVDF